MEEPNALSSSSGDEDVEMAIIDRRGRRDSPELDDRSPLSPLSEAEDNVSDDAEIVEEIHDSSSSSSEEDVQEVEELGSEESASESELEENDNERQIQQLHENLKWWQRKVKRKALPSAFWAMFVPAELDEDDDIASLTQILLECIFCHGNIQWQHLKIMLLAINMQI